MEQIQIRECVAKDAIFLCELNKNEMGYDYPRDKTESKLRELLKSNAEARRAPAAAPVYERQVHPDGSVIQ